MMLMLGLFFVLYFQVFSHVIVPPFESSALYELVELFMTDWLQIIHFRWDPQDF